MRPRVLFISNGSGEDSIASLIASRLTGVEAEAMPTVGQGAAYRGVLPLAGPRQAPMPSGGLVNDAPLSHITRDLRSGLLALLLRQFRFLRQVRRQYQLFVVVGDVFALLNAFAGLRPLLFIGTAKSVLHHRYSWPERLALRHLADRVLTRDEATASDLRRSGVRAAWVGNPMMDALEPAGITLPLNSEMPWMALFPGSRAEAYAELPKMLDVYTRLWLGGDRVRAVVAVADSLQLEQMVPPGWEMVVHSAERGLVGELLRDGLPPVLLVRRVLGDVLARCQLVFGQAGTANEQAAGLGLPVLAYGPGGERRMSWYRFRQKGLLGDAVEVVDDRPEVIVAALARLLRDPEERRRRGAVGRERMGPPGGAARMAAWIESLAHGQPPP